MSVLVHAQLPTVKPSDPHYSDASSWVWVPCLEFPVERVNQLKFSSKPFKWIRYCIGAVTGARGHLSRRADLLDAVDYDQTLPLEQESVHLYYHVSDAEKELMFPTDPHLADPRKTNSVDSRAATTTSSVGCEAFRQDLLDRDIWCLITGSDEGLCDAVHLVPHCRDDEVRIWPTYVPFVYHLTFIYTRRVPCMPTVHQDAHHAQMPWPRRRHRLFDRRRAQRSPSPRRLPQNIPPNPRFSSGTSAQLLLNHSIF